MATSSLDPLQKAAAFYRPASEVMKLARMGSAHPTRLSFLRIMMRRMKGEGWRFERPVWQIDTKGVGRAVYCAIGPERTYSLVAFAHDLPSEMRSDRVIATAWDSTFALFDGVPDTADLDHLQANVPLQEAGRVGASVLSLSRANRSVRLFAHVVERLAAGRQPDRAEIDAVGYLMRTTAVYGSGKFGAADRSKIADRPELSAPFQAEMLSVWLTRQFAVDIVEHLAAERGGAAATRLEPDIKQALGVGNSTGLGMAPFIIRHPILLNNWMMAREEALARVRAQKIATADALKKFGAALQQAQINAEQWRSVHPIQIEKLKDLRQDLAAIAKYLAQWPGSVDLPWDKLWLWGASQLSLEGQEALLALMLEPHADLVDGLANYMAADEKTSFPIDGTMRIEQLRQLLGEQYNWALDIDFDDQNNSARFWYVSEEKLEPRLGERYHEDGAKLEQPLCIARLAKELYQALAHWRQNSPVAEFLLAHPAHRYMVRRVQKSVDYPFAEVRDNLICQDMLPIDLMRCKLAFFGASRFDPRSDRWVRISLFQGMFYPDDLNKGADP